MNIDYEDLYRRWAEHKFDLYKVDHVSFDSSYYEGCPTCGDGGVEYEVYVTYWPSEGASKRGQSFDVNFDTSLINEIIDFAYKHGHLPAKVVER